ncbi:MAG: SdrD B-like domain-containing protein, partial [Anaerolineae bacterium]
MKHLRMAALTLVLVLSVATPTVWAVSPDLPDQVTMGVTWPGTDSGAPSYFDIAVSGGTTLDGTYDGYCLDTDSAFPDSGTANVFSSYGLLPPNRIEYPENLDLVNWILNQDFVGQPSGCGGDYTYGDVQWAIWHLLEDNPTPGALGSLGEWSECRADEIVDAAYANGEGFVPGCGDVLGIILIREGNWWQYQPVIIEVRLACIGDYVWEDLNANGIQDDGNTGINGVTVNLYDCTGNPIASTTTADDAAGNPGYYLFDGLPPGCYEVEFVAPDGTLFSPPNQGADDALDSDAD